MNILLIGGGGREHAFAWKLAQSPLLDVLYVAPGNGGTSVQWTNVDLDLDDHEQIRGFVKTHDIDMIVCGPEQPLVDGLANSMADFGINVVGPSKEGALLEGSKSFAKAFMDEFNIPTAKYGAFSADQEEEAKSFIEEMPTPIVLKADGLAAGKGVLILNSKEEAKSELNNMFSGKFGSAGSTVVVEHFLTGIEFSVFALTDGTDYILLPVAKDYKRIGEGDTGLNTGGMGTVSPPPFVDQQLMQKVEENVVKPTIRGIKEKGIDYKGFVFFGLISVNNEPYVIEYNCRMGDPETQVVLPRMKTDLLTCFKALFDGTIKDITITSTDKSCVAVVMASGGYPESYEKGKPIMLPATLDDEEILFHAGTQSVEGKLITSGGRVLACCALGNDLAMARNKAYDLAESVRFDKAYYRKDIGLDLMTHV